MHASWNILSLSITIDGIFFKICNDDTHMRSSYVRDLIILFFLSRLKRSDKIDKRYVIVGDYGNKSRKKKISYF